MKTKVIVGSVLSSMFVLSGCTDFRTIPGLFNSQAPEATAPAVAQPAPQVLPQALPAPSGVTAATLDTTTEAQKSEALTADTSGSTALGTAIVTLGAPTDQGVWVKTSLVSSTQPGQVEYKGKTINVELRPRDSAGGDQISLPAMRLLDAPLSGIVVLEVYSG